jgi:hypothetical protein
LWIDTGTAAGKCFLDMLGVMQDLKLCRKLNEFFTLC